MAPPSKQSFSQTLLHDEMITILAGPDPQTYSVQRALLASASDWFRAAVSNRFKERHTRILRLPDADPAVAEDFLYWLYHGRLEIETAEEDYEADDPDDAEEKAMQTQRCIHAIRLWSFADAYFLPNLQNHAMQELFEAFLCRYPWIEVIRAGYELTPPGSPVRRLVMDEVKEGLRHRAINAGKDGEVAGRGYLVSQLDLLGAIPGFTNDLTNVLLNYNMANITPMSSIEENGKGVYYVPDGTECMHE